MADLKTLPNDADVDAYLDALEPEARRAGARTLHSLLSSVTGEPGQMWGEAIVGYGSYDYRYDSGRSGTWFKIGFAPRKRELTVYLMDGAASHPEVLGRLGRHRVGRSCLYLPRMDQVDLDVLEELVSASWNATPMGGRSAGS